MKLSVVIVSYNVRLLLEACLQSVEKALKGIDGEIFVVTFKQFVHSVQYFVSRCKYTCFL